MRIPLNKQSKPVIIEEHPFEGIFEKILGPIEIIEHPLPAHLEGVLPAEERFISAMMEKAILSDKTVEILQELYPPIEGTSEQTETLVKYVTDVCGWGNYSPDDRLKHTKTTLEIRLINWDELSFKEDKGYRWNFKVLRGNDTGFSRGEEAFTWEDTLNKEFKILEPVSEEESVSKRRGRPKRSDGDEKSLAAPILPTYEFPLVPEDRPWGRWPTPVTETGRLQDFRVTINGPNELCLANTDLSRNLGIVTTTAVEELGRRCEFPPNFVNKLSPRTAFKVINERIMASSGPEFNMLFEDGKWTNILPAWRGILPTKTIGEIVYSKLVGLYPDIEVDVAERGEGWAHFRFLTPVAYPVTKQVGDILRMGLDVSSQYGETIEVSLFTKRLICLNGMISNRSEFSWRQRSDEAGSAQMQALWLEERIMGTLCSYNSLIEKAKELSLVTFEGDPAIVLRERAAAMGLAKRYIPKLLDSFSQEDGNTEWSLVNAFTRLAAHYNLEKEVSRDLMFTAGNWVEHFDVVSCRAPRPLANKLGLKITDEEII